MKTLKIFALFVAILTSSTHMHGSVPIIVSSGARHRALGNLCNHAQDQVRSGDLTGAMRKVETILHADPKFWPALYVRAQIFVAQGKYELAIQDCNEALRQYRGFIDASAMRAVINAHLGKYTEPLKELNYLRFDPSAQRYSREGLEAAGVVSSHLSRRIISQWSTGDQRREGCVQHYDMEGREHHRYACCSLR